MHELGIAKDLFEIIKEKARQKQLIKITKITIKLGVASGIEKDFLEHSFYDHIFPGSFAEGAKIEIVSEPVIIKCKKCHKELNSDKFTVNCPNCNSFDLEIISGKDVYIENIEGEK